MVRSAESEHNCPICNKPVDLKTTKTNAAGRPVHEECYVLKQALLYVSRVTQQRPTPL
jgi:hypothetical protein